MHNDIDDDDEWNAGVESSGSSVALSISNQLFSKAQLWASATVPDSAALMRAATFIRPTRADSMADASAGARPGIGRHLSKLNSIAVARSSGSSLSQAQGYFMRRGASGSMLRGSTGQPSSGSMLRGSSEQYSAAGSMVRGSSGRYPAGSMLKAAGSMLRGSSGLGHTAGIPRGASGRIMLPQMSMKRMQLRFINTLQVRAAECGGVRV